MPSKPRKKVRETKAIYESVPYRLKSVRIRNFKSLKDVFIDFDDFNVLVGENGSGKTNVLESLVLLKNVTSEGAINPFVRYGGYKNLVWRGQEDLNVEISLVWYASAGAPPIEYELSFNGYGGEFRILKEQINQGMNGIRKEGTKGPRQKGGLISGIGSLHSTTSLLNSFNLHPRHPYLAVVKDLIKNIQVFNFDPRIMKELSSFRRVDIPGFSGEDFQTYLYNVFSRNGNSWNEEVTSRLKLVFPGFESMSLIPTEDGRVMLRVRENGINLRPDSLSDGFFKILAILVLSSESKDCAFFIDEIENSIYPEAIEVVIDALKESRNSVVLTTHSPIVLNMSGAGNIVLLSKEADETNAVRIKDPKKLEKELRSKGLSIGDGWLYHALE
jgi:predicted ATPase